MPIVSVNPNDATGSALLATAALRVVYRLSKLAVGGAFAFVRKPIYVYPDPVTNIASKNLVALDNLNPPGLFYRVTIEYADPNAFDIGRGYQEVEGFSADLYLGQVGGNLADLLQLRLRSDETWINAGAVIPIPQAQYGDLIMDSLTGELFTLE